MFTINQKDFDKIKNSSDFSVIGHITDLALKSGVNLITKAQQKIPITSKDGNHFKFIIDSISSISIGIFFIKLIGFPLS